MPGSTESSCQYGRTTKSDIIQQPGLAIVLRRFCIYEEFFNSPVESPAPVEKNPGCNQHHEQHLEGTGAGAGPLGALTLGFLC